MVAPADASDMHTPTVAVSRPTAGKTCELAPAWPGCKGGPCHSLSNPGTSEIAVHRQTAGGNQTVLENLMEGCTGCTLLSSEDSGAGWFSRVHT